MTYDTIVTALTVLPQGKPIFAEGVTTVRLDDEAAGLFVVIEQHPDDGPAQKISMDAEEWPHIRQAIESMVQTCHERNAQEGA